MHRDHGSHVTLLDLHPPADTFRDDVLAGLCRDEKSLPCKYFYDQRGSHLFEQICQLEEYYPARAETAMMHKHAAEMAARIGPNCQVIEYGSGSSAKTRILLDHLQRPAAYVPIDISREHLRSSAARLATRYPQLQVLPVCADFNMPIDVPAPRQAPAKRVVYFPGSTIGNFDPRATRKLLHRFAAQCGSGGGLLIGIDLKKDKAILEAAYNDRQGVTAAFNLNLLVRINRELDGGFQIEQFRHDAFYNEAAGRIEMHLVSQTNQIVTVDGVEIAFELGERIHTENSYKYTVEEFADLAAAYFKPAQAWTDRGRLFAILYLECR